MPYAYQATVSIPAATGSTLTNISLVLTGSDTKLKTVANGGQIQNTVTRVGQTVPADLIVSSDSAGLSLYNWGFDFYDGTNGIATIWILMPSHSSSASTTVYISIGNSSVSTFQGGSVGGEFDTATKAAYHFSEASYTTAAIAKDSSSSANDLTIQSSNGTTVGSSNAGKITAGTKGALKLPNLGNVFAGAYANTSSNSGIGTTVGSVSAWIQFISISSFDTATNVLVSPSKASPYNYFGLVTSGSGATVASVMTNLLGAPKFSGNTAAYSITTWYHFFMTYDNTNLNIYQNGSLVNATAGSWARTGDSPIFLNYGDSDYIGFRYQNAIYDEVRLVNSARTANWIATEYGNQSSIPAMGSFSAISSGFTPKLTLLGAG